MKRQVFYSFHYDKDAFRVQQIRNIGAFDGNEPVSSNDWESVKRGGDTSIQNWIDNNMKYKNCVIVLIGEETSERHWVRYEIKKAWSEGRALLGIYIHNLKCPRLAQQSPWSEGRCNQGRNPFETFKTANGTLLSNVVSCHNPNFLDPYNAIKQNIEKWVEDAIRIRDQYK